MTDCHTCGHPILDGQKVDHGNVITARKSHYNPADHLPTLLKGQANVVLYINADGQMSIERNVVSQNERETLEKLTETIERERAAKMVRSWPTNIMYKHERLALAEQIESGGIDDCLPARTRR